MTEQQRDREDATLWGTFYPRGYIVGVVYDWHKAEAAALPKERSTPIRGRTSWPITRS